MTKQELNEISKETKLISKRLSLLDPNNVIENQERDRLFHRLDFLEYKIDCFLISERRRHLRVVSA